jgi:UDPglucose 6-dehydrogenase
VKPDEKLAIAVIGTGYVGLTTGLALAYLGHRVTCVDKNEAIVEKLNAGEATIYEPGVQELLAESAENIAFTGSMAGCLHNPDIIIIAVGTPAKLNGDTDLCFVEAAAREVGALLAPGKPVVLVNKSTVPIGTARRVETVVKEELAKRGVSCRFSVASNPEFLREGAALHDTFYPDRIVVGAEDVGAANLVRQMYAPILEQSFTPPKAAPRPEGYALPALVTTSPTSAELIKYAANAFLAMKISFINEFAVLSDRVGADIREVARGIGLDRRIGPGFLNAGAGWGGSCFPKDTRSILFTARQYNHDLLLVGAAVEANCRQRKTVIEKLQAALKVIRGSTIGILGLSFKANTDDIRDSAAIDVIRELLEMGARVRVYDPVAMEKYRQGFPEQDLFYAASVAEAAREADALVLLTDWEEFLHQPWRRIAGEMRAKVFIDGRNLMRGDEMRRWGYQYMGIGCQ